VVLNTQPTANVTIGLSSADPTEGTVSTSTLTFTPSNWNVAQTVTVTGVNDFVDDGDIAYSIVTAAASSADANYNGLNAADVSVTNTDNDTAGITVSPTSGLVTTEAGGTATFTVVLNSEPTADVTIGLSSSDTTEGTVSSSSLVFTPANWNVAQTVTVSGVDDALLDGDIAYSIVTAAAASADSNYSGLNAADVSVTNTDNDASGFTVSPTSGLVTTEAGGTATFTVVLNTQPTANVMIGLSSNDTTEGTVSTTTLTFTPANWNVAQTVTVSGVDDFVDDGDIGYSIVTAAAVSADSNYNGLNAADVSLTNIDNDTAGITVSPTSGLVTTEAGGTATFTVVLNSEPTANVTIGLNSSDPTEGTVSSSSLTFTSANWNVAQMVTVTGVDDLLVDGNVAYSIVTAAALSSDSNYNGLNVADVNVTNQDNDPSRRPSRPVPPAGGPTPPAPPTNPILRAFAVQSDFIAVTTSANDGMNSGFRALPNAVMGTIGVDTLRGSLGDDVIIGLQGSDVLEGLLGADKFVYQANSDSSDTIVDFNKEQGDRIVLGELLRGNGYNGNSPITDEYIRFSPASNGGSFLQVDPDGVNPGQPINLVYFPGLTVSQLADPSIFL
jgi:hypothetical protein